jgi:hypothetical protein
MEREAVGKRLIANKRSEQRREVCEWLYGLWIAETLRRLLEWLLC